MYKFMGGPPLTEVYKMFNGIYDNEAKPLIYFWPFKYNLRNTFKLFETNEFWKRELFSTLGAVKTWSEKPEDGYSLD